MAVNDTIAAFRHVVSSSSVLNWSGLDQVYIRVGEGGSSLHLFRDLRNAGFIPSFVEERLQGELDADRDGAIPAGSEVTFRVPRNIDDLIVARNISDLLSIPSAQLREPIAYVLISGLDSANFFSHIQGEDLSPSDGQVLRYHGALELWAVLREKAEANLDETLLFFGTRRTDISPGFRAADIESEIVVNEIGSFAREQDRAETRKDIFVATLSEFLRDQNPTNAFPYLLRNSEAFGRRLREGLSIYLAEHSPEKLEEEAATASLDFSGKLEKIISGLEAKSLSIPAAVLLSVKEVDTGAGFTIVNGIIALAALTYAITMTLVDQSQRTLLSVLDVTIREKKKELRDKGLEENNPVLQKSFLGIERRSGRAAVASIVMCAVSWVPIACVLFASFMAAPKGPLSVIISQSQAGSQSTNSAIQAAPNPYDIKIPELATNPGAGTPVTNAPATTNSAPTTH